MSHDSYPGFLSIQTTSSCNARCVFCPQEEVKEAFGNAVMSDELFLKIIRECGMHRDIERLILYLNNEPFTDPKICERITIAKETVPWASVHILTNGSLLTRENARKLAESKADWVGISMHGIRKETVEKAMGIDFETTLRRVLDFIDIARKSHEIKEYVMMTFLKHQYMSDDEMEEAKRFWKEHGIERISAFDGPVSRAGNVANLVPARHKRIAGCNSIWANEMIHIVENGDVVLCCMDWRREVILGNLRENSIGEIWNSRKYAEIRDKRDGRLPSEDGFICTRCEAAVPAPEREVTVDLPAAVAAVDPSACKSAVPDILLVICPMWDIAMPPLGITTLAAYLEAKGFRVALMDLNIELYSQATPEMKCYWDMRNYPFWSSEDLYAEYISYPLRDMVRAAVRRIIASGARRVGFSVYASNTLFSLEIVAMLKQADPGITVIVGGPSCFGLEPQTNIPWLFFSPARKLLFEPGMIDVFVCGEGEETLEEIVRGERKDTIAGAIQYINGKYTSLVPRELQQDLDRFPAPAFHSLDMSKYTEGRLPIVMSRGCLRKCSFCNDWRITEGKFRARSAESVFAEIVDRVRTYNIHSFIFNDLLINGNLKQLERLCDLLIESGLQVWWSGQGIIRTDMDTALLSKIKRSGCINITFGVESFSSKVLTLMNKPFTPEQAGKVLASVKKAGIGTGINFIAGFPGEGEEEFCETYRYVQDFREYIDMVSSVNACNVTATTDLEIRPDDFHIFRPPGNGCYYWRSTDGTNTYEIRKARVKRLVSLFHDLKIPVLFVGIYDDVVIEKNAQKSDIILVTLPPWGVQNPPLGLGFLEAFLLRQGFKPRVLDLNIAFHNAVDGGFRMLWHVENKSFWSADASFPLILELFKTQIDDAVARIGASSAPVVGFSVVDPKERITAEFIRRLKAASPGKTIILGGPACSTAEQRNYFRNTIPGLIDYFVVGEGEEPLAEILCRQKERKRDSDIPGTAVFRDGAWNVNERPPLDPFDRAGFPVYSGFDRGAYTGTGTFLVQWSRGCRGKCSFCKNHRLEPGFRSRSVQSILEELCFLTGQFAVKELTVADNALNGDLAVLSGVCAGIIEKGIKVRWSGQMAPRPDMEAQLFAAMAQAGCTKVQIGVESGSAKVLKAMRKIYLPQTCEKALRLASQAGLETEIFIIIGFPGETEKDFQATVDFIKRNAAYISTVKSINTLHLIAGTEIYEHPRDFDIKPLPSENWHYLWETNDGNTYEVRKRRAQRLVRVCEESGLRVMETNISEGKEMSASSGCEDSRCGLERLKQTINRLQALPRGQMLLPVRPFRGLCKFVLLALTALFTLAYITYFWFFKKLRGRALLGGE